MHAQMTHAGDEQSATRERCLSCGMTMPADARHCPYCHEATRRWHALQSPPAPSRRRLAGLARLVPALLVIAGLGLSALGGEGSMLGPALTTSGSLAVVWQALRRFGSPGG